MLGAAIPTALLAEAYRALAAAMDEGADAAAEAGGGPLERMQATVTAYRRFAIDKPRRYELMFNLEYEPERRTVADHPLGTVRRAWIRAVDSYLAEADAARRAEAEILATHVWTAVHGQLVLWRTLPSPVASSEAVLVELEQSLLDGLLPVAGRSEP